MEISETFSPVEIFHGEEPYTYTAWSCPLSPALCTFTSLGRSWSGEGVGTSSCSIPPRPCGNGMGGKLLVFLQTRHTDLGNCHYTNFWQASLGGNWREGEWNSLMRQPLIWKSEKHWPAFSLPFWTRPGGKSTNAHFGKRVSQGRSSRLTPKRSFSWKGHVSPRRHWVNTCMLVISTWRTVTLLVEI